MDSEMADNFFNTDQPETISNPPPPKKTRVPRASLIGKVLNNPRDKNNEVEEAMEDAIRDIKRAWRGCLKSTDYRVKELKDGFLRFSFKDPLDRQWVMDERPWVLGSQGHLLLLEEGCPYVRPSMDMFGACPLWIQAHGIPVQLMSQELGFEIGRVFGAEALQVEVDENGVYLRIKVMVNVKKRVMSGCWLVLPKNGKGVDKVLWVTFVFEELPYMCFSCGIIGHTAFSCWNDRLPAAMDRELDHDCVMIEYNGGENEKPVVSEGQMLIDTRKVGYGSWMQDQSLLKEGESYIDLDDCGPNFEDRRKREGKIVLAKAKKKAKRCCYQVNEENVINVVLQPKP